MTKSQITIKDIAHALKVSLSTVSRALKDNPDISKETRELVQTYAKDHHYKPNAMAVNLRVSRSNTIGVIVPQLVHFFFSSVLNGIEEMASKAGYNILIAQSNESYEKEVEIIHSFLASRVCGVIASLAKETSQYSHYQELLTNDIPVVFYDRICTGLKTERVVVDDYAGSFAAVEYLIKTGCKRICFYGAAPHLEITKNRRNGYLDALHKHKISVDKSLIQLCDTREQAMILTPQLMKSENPPDAFFAINDDTAAGILYACKDMGIKIPEEVSICGFGESIIAQSTDPKLTTVEQRGEKVGEYALEILLNKIEKKGKVGNRIVKTKLIVRDSTK